MSQEKPVSKKVYVVCIDPEGGLETWINYQDWHAGHMCNSETGEPINPMSISKLGWDIVCQMQYNKPVYYKIPAALYKTKAGWAIKSPEFWGREILDTWEE